MPWALERALEQRLRMHELADTAVIARSTLTRLVAKLEKDGLVARERVADDRRGADARRIIEAWRIDDNEERPHSSLAYRTPEEPAHA